MGLVLLAWPNIIEVNSGFWNVVFLDCEQQQYKGCIMLWTLINGNVHKKFFISVINNFTLSSGPKYVRLSVQPYERLRPIRFGPCMPCMLQPSSCSGTWWHVRLILSSLSSFCFPLLTWNVKQMLVFPQGWSSALWFPCILFIIITYLPDPRQARNKRQHRPPRTMYHKWEFPVLFILGDAEMISTGCSNLQGSADSGQGSPSEPLFQTPSCDIRFGAA